MSLSALEDLMALCQVPVDTSDVSQHQQLAAQVQELADKYDLDLSKPEKLSVGSYNPLVEACHKGNLAIVKVFVERGAGLNFVDPERRSPLYSAIRGLRNSHENVAQLLKWGAEVNFNNQEKNPLYESFYSMNKEMSRLLIQQGADVNSVILPSFCFVESLFSLNTNLVMMVCGFRFNVESISDLVSLASEIVMAGLSPRKFFLSSQRFIENRYTKGELSSLWAFQHLCLALGFQVDRFSLDETIDDLNEEMALHAKTDMQSVIHLKDRIDHLCWTRTFLSSPLPLTYLVRNAIRGLLVLPSVSRGRHLNKNIASLPLPQIYKDFLVLKRCTIQGVKEFLF